MLNHKTHHVDRLNGERIAVVISFSDASDAAEYVAIIIRLMTRRNCMVRAIGGVGLSNQVRKRLKCRISFRGAR